MKKTNENKSCFVRILGRASVITTVAIVLNFSPCTQAEAAEPDVILTISVVKYAVQPVEEDSVRPEARMQASGPSRGHRNGSLSARPYLLWSSIATQPLAFFSWNGTERSSSPRGQCCASGERKTTIKHEMVPFFEGIVEASLFLIRAPAQDLSWDEQIRAGRRYQQQSHYSEAEKSFLEALKKAEQFGQADPRLATSWSYEAKTCHAGCRGKPRRSEGSSGQSSGKAQREPAGATQHPY